MRHFGFLPRSPWSMIGWKNWVQKLINDQLDKLFNNPQVPHQTNQIQTQIMIETGQPVVGRDASHEPGHEQSMLNEVDIDFRILGLPHSDVNQAWNSRVFEVVKKIDNHPHRHVLQRDLQQNKAYNPFSTTTKQMIQDVGNVEMFDMFETDPKTQSTKCFSYWSEGIVYCTCGHFLKEIVANRGFIEYKHSIPEYIFKKGRSHGHIYGKTPEKQENHLAHNLKKRCMKRDHKGIHDRFSWDHFSVSVCSNMIEMKMFVMNGEMLQKKISFIECQKPECFHYRQNWSISRSLKTQADIEKPFWLQPSVV